MDNHGIVDERFPLSSKQIQDFCNRNHIRRLSLFGSILRDDFHPDSDIDVLLEFYPDFHIGLFGIARLEMELSKGLNRAVDISTPEFLSKAFRSDVIQQAEVLYESIQ